MSATADEFACTGAPGVREVESILAPPYRRTTVGIVAIVLMIAFEAMAVATVMPVAVRALSGLSLYAWGFSAFLITSLFGMVVAGEVNDTRGPRLPFIAGGVSFAAGLLVAGVAPHMPVFILGRALQGLGAGLLIVTLYVIVARGYPEVLHPRVFSALSSAWVLPAIVGPAIGGWVAEAWTWRAVFLGVIPLIAMAAILVLPTVQRLGGGSAAYVPRRGRKRLALATALGAALLQYAGQHLVWSSLLVVLAGLALLVPSLPRLLPAGTLRAARGLPTTVLMRGVLAGAFFGAETFVPLMLVTERDLSAAVAGLTLTGGALGWAAGSWYQGRPTTTVSRPTLVRVGCLLVALGIAVVALALAPALPPYIAGAGWVVAGLGMGMAMASFSVLTLEMSGPQEQGRNSAALQISDGLGGITFIGLGGVIFAAFHSGGASEATFLAIYAVMIMVASAGFVLAPRIRIRS